MAFTVTNVTHPNQNVWEGEFLGQKAKVVDLTWDNAYDNTNGEVLTAATLGYQQIYGAFLMAAPWSGTTTDLSIICVPVINAARTQVSFRAFRYDGASAGKAAFEEFVTTGLDLSAYTMRVCIIGS